MGFVILRNHTNRVCGVDVGAVWGRLALGRLAKCSVHSEDGREQSDRGFVETHLHMWKTMSYQQSYPTMELGPCKRFQRGFMLSVSFLIPQEKYCHVGV